MTNAPYGDGYQQNEGMIEMKIKKLISILFILLLCSLISTVVLAGAPEDVIVSLQIDNPMMEVNGENAEIDLGRGTKPMIIEGRTLVPIRAIIEAFGGTVGWDEGAQAVLLNLEGNTIKLGIGSKTAYLNNKAETLDVAPAIYNERTMLPIRFVAEGFNLGVAWDDATRTVYVIRNRFDAEEAAYLDRVVPAYTGSPYAIINNNQPMFEEYEIIPGSFEYYSTLDELKRCDVAFSSVAKDLMPTEERGNISSVKPTGWVNNRYDVVPGGYLYNRCHLIGFQLTGENANKRNLITGTRYLNTEGMLPFENQVANYIKRTGNHVVYRITPVFHGNQLLAEGVLMEGYSVEDDGRGISFCVYCYNVQPGIYLDYATGENSLAR